MKHLKLFILAGLAFSSVAFADTAFECGGKYVGGREASFSIVFASPDRMMVETPSVGNVLLELDEQDARYRYYNGFTSENGDAIELKIPQGVTLSGEDATQEFKIVLKIAHYSEVGHVVDEVFKGWCQRDL